MEGGGNGLERELNYYRRECNDLGARLLRLQEEQSQAFREARRSRTVVKLLRETYRLGDFATSTQDIGGATLELVVDNAMCDRAALLREEQQGSGRFLIVHAIGLPASALNAVLDLGHPPGFFYTSVQNTPTRCSEQVVATMGVPFVLWSYDSGSGHALVIGNRLESNVNRPFEPGDQELIESALSIYLDVLYRKHAEAQLRQAKQAAEEARDSRIAFLLRLADELREPIEELIRLCERWQEDEAASGGRPATVRWTPRDAMKLARHIRLLVSEAAKREADPAQPASLQPEWIPVDEMVRGALRFAYAASIKSNVDIGCRLPNRRCAVLIDRLQMGRVLQQLLLSAVKATPGGGSVRVAANRRSDGGLEIVFSSRGAGPLAVAHPQPEKTLDGAAWWDGLSMEGARRTIAAHRGIMTVESSAFGGTAVRLILPAQCTRDIAMSEGDGEGEGDPDVA